jgi:hypothetical protein
MGFTNAAKNAALDGIGSAASYLSFHTADPGSTGTSEVTGGTYARVQTTWGAASAAAKTGSQVAANIPAGTTITYWGLWTASSGGTFYNGKLLLLPDNTTPAPESFGSAGTYQFTPTLTASG